MDVPPSDPLPSRPPVGVVGASARAAAHSLVRAGYAPWAVDLYDDRDLGLVGPSALCPVDDYPEALPALAGRFPPGPVLYTGGLENYPEVVADLAARRQVLGVGPDVLRRVREPHFLGRTLAPAGLPFPDVLRAGVPFPPDREWMSKPVGSAGGRGVRFARPDDAPDPTRYVQEFVEGRPMSALFRTAADATTLLGVTDQLVGAPWLHAPGFQYAGTVGPVALAGAIEARVRGLGGLLARAGGLAGLWGLDFILAGDTPYPIEINPRYTAAMEVLEHATGDAVFGQPTPPPARPTEGVKERSPHGCVGKAIYYAPHRLTFPPAGPWDANLAVPFDPWRLPGYADVAPVGVPVEPGEPVITIFAAGSTPEEVRAKLMGRAAELDRLFEPEAGG